MPRKRKSPDVTASTPSDITVPVDPSRVEQVIVWLLDGARSAQIVASIVEHWPDQNVLTLLTEATTQLEKKAIAIRERPDVMQGFLIEAHLLVYKKLLDTGDFVGALRALKQLGDIT